MYINYSCWYQVSDLRNYDQVHALPHEIWCVADVDEGTNNGSTLHHRKETMLPQLIYVFVWRCGETVFLVKFLDTDSKLKTVYLAKNLFSILKLQAFETRKLIGLFKNNRNEAPSSCTTCHHLQSVLATALGFPMPL